MVKGWIILYLQFSYSIFQNTLNVYKYRPESFRMLSKISTSKGLNSPPVSKRNAFTRGWGKHLKMIFFWYSSKMIAILIQIWLLFSKMKPLSFICTQFGQILVSKNDTFVELPQNAQINKNKLWMFINFKLQKKPKERCYRREC